MRKPGLGKLKGAFAALRGMFGPNPAKRELAELTRHRDLVKLSAGEQRSRDLMLAGAQDAGAMVALVGTENRIAQMVAEQTRGFRKDISELHGHISALSQRIMYLENPNRPKLGERGSGTGIFPRSGKVQPELVGRPGTIKDAVAEHVAGLQAHATKPSTLEAQRETNDELTRIVGEACRELTGPNTARDPQGRFAPRNR